MDAPAASSRSTTASTDRPEPPDDDRPRPELSGELADELENFAGGLFELAGVVMNRAVRRRTHQPENRQWLVTEQEAEDFGAAAGRIAGRRVPEELREGDGADAVIIGSVVLGYGMRNLTGVSELDQLRAAMRPTPPPADVGPPAEPPQPAPAAPPPPPEMAASSRSGGPVVVGVEEAAPPPPDVISPDL